MGAPDAVYLGQPPSSGQVSYVYAPRPGLPATSDPAVGALVTQFRADLQTEFFGKILGPDTTLRSVNVGGVEGYWIDPKRRRIPDHWHAHARPAGGFFDPASPLAGKL